MLFEKGYFVKQDETPKDLIDFLMDPRNLPERPSSVTHIETHISHVFLGDTVVYKIKKPVNFGFVDFSHLRKRQLFCNKEVMLNSRLAPSIYLGVTPLYGGKGTYSFVRDRSSHPAEYAVKMKRIPMDCLLFNLITQGRALYGELTEVGRVLADFHRVAHPYHGSRYGNLESMVAVAKENFAQIEPFLGMTLEKQLYDALVSYTMDFLDTNKTLFNDRKKAGFIRDGHGDLHCQHICLERPPVIFDCIEFNDSLRIIDVLQDIAFLLMDLEYRGRFDLTSCLMKSYLDKQQDHANDDLLRFFKTYRAVVRAKVEGLTAGSLENDQQREAALQRSRNYFRLAEHYIRSHRRPFNPIVFMGLSGSGKSTISRDFAAEAVIVRSDEVRKGILGVSPEEHRYVSAGEGLYAAEITAKIYCALVDRAVGLAREGKKVVVDATYLKANQRQHLYHSCLAANLNPFFVYCAAAEDVLRERIRQRMRDGRDISDAHLGVLEHQLSNLERPDELPSFRVLRINTEEALHNIVAALREFL